mmetsp:Transcript_17598/g.29711  ORF Transcript_17598/g.29711 Transcript_17598/m.29711 type:complete len:139 (+) Transcript_17598:547-963(+)
MIEKDQLYREKLIYITNRGGNYRIDKCFSALNTILSKADIAQFYFNTNDLNLIMDIALREVLIQSCFRTKVEILKLMETIMDNPIYSQYQHRLEDVQQMIEEQVLLQEGAQTEEKALLEQISQLAQFVAVGRAKGAAA